MIYFWREIGESDWTECSKEWHDHVNDQPQYDTKKVPLDSKE